MEKKGTVRTSLKGSKTIPESLSAAPAALVTVAELLSLRRGAEERRGPTMPATMVVAEREVEEEVEVERLMCFFFFERGSCELPTLFPILQSSAHASVASSHGWRRGEQQEQREKPRRNWKQMSPSNLDVAVSPTQKKKKKVGDSRHRAPCTRFSSGSRAVGVVARPLQRKERRSDSRREFGGAKTERREEAFFLSKRSFSRREGRREESVLSTLFPSVTRASLPFEWKQTYLAASDEGARSVESILARERDLTKRFKR